MTGRARAWAGTAAVAALAGSIIASSQAAATTARPDVIVIGSSQLRWQQLDEQSTPALWQLASGAATGALSIKAVDSVTCPSDGWLTLGAGNRATAQDTSRRFCGDPSGITLESIGKAARVIGFAGLVRHNAGLTDGTRIGALGGALHSAGQCVSAAGAAAALGAADPSGDVAEYRPDAATAAADSAFLRACPVTLISTDMTGIDQVVDAVRNAAPAGSELLVVGLADTPSAGAHLHVALAAGPAFRAGELTSASTSRAPYVQLVDVAPTILALRGVREPSSMIGEPWRTAGGATAASMARRVRAMSDLDLAARRQQGVVVPFFLAMVAFMVIASAAGWWLARRAARRAPEGPPVRSWQVEAAAVGCTLAAMAPAGSFLASIAPWWRAAHPLGALAAATVVGTLAAAALGWLLDAAVWQRRPLGLLGGAGLVTVGVIAVDLVSGAHLQIDSPAGYSPLVAGRFAGIGNVGFGVFAAGAVLAVAALVDVAPLLAGIVALGAVAVDGGPSWGGDVGGVLSQVPAFLVLGGLVKGLRASWRRIAGVLLAAVGVVGALGAVDYARPADHQTHLGRFVGKLLHGGAWTVVRRKAVSDADLLVHSALTLLIPLLVVAALLVVARPRGVLRLAFERVPLLRYGLIGALVMAIVGALVNDSGVAIPALAVLVVLPASVTAVLRAAVARP